MCWQPVQVCGHSGDTGGGRKCGFWGKACLRSWGISCPRVGSLSGRTKNILAKLVLVSAPPGFGPCLVRFLAGSQARGSLLGQTVLASSPLLLHILQHTGQVWVQLLAPSDSSRVQAAWPRLSLLPGDSSSCSLVEPQGRLSQEDGAQGTLKSRWCK